MSALLKSSDLLVYKQHQKATEQREPVKQQSRLCRNQPHTLQGSQLSTPDCPPRSNRFHCTSFWHRYRPEPHTTDSFMARGREKQGLFLVPLAWQTTRPRNALLRHTEPLPHLSRDTELHVMKHMLCITGA